MRVLQAVQALDSTVATDADAASQARPVAVERDDQRLVEAARVVGVGGVAQVMLDALQLRAEPKLVEGAFELLLPAVKGGGFAAPLFGSALGDIARDDAFACEHPIGERLEHPLLITLVRIARPGTFGRTEGTRACAFLSSSRVSLPWSRRESPSPCQVPLKQLRLFVAGQKRVDDLIDFAGGRAGGLQGVIERAPGKPVLELDAREALFGGGIGDDAILHQCHRRVLVERRNTQHFHDTSPLDEGRTRFETSS